MRRRSVLQGLGIAPLALVAGPARAASRSTERLLIADVAVFKVPVNARGNWLIVRLRTQNGLTGRCRWG